jgi:hypothetical protein
MGLSLRERYILGRIEHRLSRDDPEFAARLTARLPRRSARLVLYLFAASVSWLLLGVLLMELGAASGHPVLAWVALGTACAACGATVLVAAWWRGHRHPPR